LKYFLIPALLLAPLALAPGLAPAFAQVSVFPPPTGLQLSTNGAKAYSGTGTPNWNVTTWSSPQPLPPFSGNTSQNSSGLVQFTATSRIALKASGTVLPCTSANGQPIEYDLFASPVVATSRPALSALHHAVLSGNVYNQPFGPFDAVCEMNVETVEDALTLKNTVNGQIIFYQLKLGGAGGKSGEMVMATDPTPRWFEQGVVHQSGTGAQFGYDDAINVYGTPLLRANISMNYSVNVLPSLLQLIKTGPPNPQVALDHNPAHWVIWEEYAGTAVWGHVASQTGWGSLSLKED
jgi:hypothetical protein